MNRREVGIGGNRELIAFQSGLSPLTSIQFRVSRPTHLIVKERFALPDQHSNAGKQTVNFSNQ